MKLKLYQIFTFVAIILIGVTYFAPKYPIWSVALQSIQYPKAMYPEGIRINFKYDGVYNGCEGVREREELAMDAGADCLLEMNKINHFIGMYPIVQGVNDINEIGEHVPYPVYAGESIPDNEIPGALKLLDNIMRNALYFFILFALLALLFMFNTKKKMLWAAIIPALVPFYFLFVYIYYLYWYGHHLGLHGGGAFAGIKPFMPTVFGEGKVAQFTTVSYPDYGFLFAFGVFVFMILAMLFKNKELRKSQA
ncbi:MAG: hypothetical protein DRI88_04025 [Bacteroidetes bacterium]|nr:MAG: hypothetical protein DRI88_04025 [Bacteroidota bacterium]RLD69566.1 MAG: hypothetical protein DRI87_09495 [Bacteroidota bacterium]